MDFIEVPGNAEFILNAVTFFGCIVLFMFLPASIALALAYARRKKRSPALALVLTIASLLTVIAVTFWSGIVASKDLSQAISERDTQISTAVGEKHGITLDQPASKMGYPKHKPRRDASTYGLGTATVDATGEQIAVRFVWAGKRMLLEQVSEVAVP